MVDVRKIFKNKKFIKFKMTSLTFEFVFEFFKERNFLLLDKKYINAHSKLKCKCSNDHIIEISYNNFKNGRRCKICSINNKKQLQFHLVKETLEKEKYILIDTIIKGKINFKCPQNHIGNIHFDKFKRGQRCAKCMNQKFSFNYVKEFFENEGYLILENNYINIHSKMKYKCPAGHTESISFNNFKKGYRCPKCFGNKKLTIEFIKEVFIKEKYTLLEETYKNSKEKMKFKCPKNHIDKISYDSFKRGRRCPKCVHKNEQRCREIIENFFNLPFKKSRPPWLNGLELDGYNEELGIGFEYNGKQHYEFIKYFHKTEERFKKMKKRDLEKIILCKKHNIKLLTIPYNKHSDEQIKNFLIDTFFN